MKSITVLVLFVLFSFNSFARGTLPIGVYLSTTGPAAAWGRLEWQGIEAAKRLKPSANNKNIRLILEDTASKPEGAAMAVSNLIHKGVKFVIGPVTTTNALAALPILEKHKIVDVIPTANGMGLTDNRKFAARVCFTNDLQSKVMAKYIASNIGYKTGVVVEDISEDYSIDLANRFIRDFEKDGGQIIKIYKIQFMQNDFSAIATHIKHINPDFVFISAYYNSIALFLRDLRGIGSNVRVFAGSAASSYSLIKIAGKNAEGLEFTDDFDPLLPQNSTAKKFIATFKKQFKRLPDSPQALAADAYLLLINAINTAKGNAAKVAQIIRNTTFNGITGKIIISKGRLERTVVIRRVHNASFEPVAVFKP